MAAILTLCGAESGFAQDVKGERLRVGEHSSKIGAPSPRMAGRWTFVGQLTNPGDTLWAFATDNLKEQNVLVRDGGTFQFTTELEEAKEYYFLTPSLIRGEGGGGYSFLVTAVPGEVLQADGFCDKDKPAEGLTYSGTSFYQYYTEAIIAGKQVADSGDAQAAINFVKAHPDCESSLTLVGAVGCYAPDRLEELLALLSPDIRSGRLSAYIDKQIADAKAYRQQKEMEGKTLPMGSMAPDFTLNDLNGQPLTLSSLRGKIVVLDFWGSWCGWCIKGFPEMKKYYEKYKDRMEILGMDCNDTDAKWKKAVADNQLPWLHVFVPRGSTVPTDYLIQAFPTKIILDTDGKVLMTIVGEAPKFYKVLDEMFK